jgi:hypothetical protein
MILHALERIESRRLSQNAGQKIPVTEKGNSKYSAEKINSVA